MIVLTFWCRDLNWCLRNDQWILLEPHIVPNRENIQLKSSTDFTISVSLQHCLLPSPLITFDTAMQAWIASGCEMTLGQVMVWEIIRYLPNWWLDTISLPFLIYPVWGKHVHSAKHQTGLPMTRCCLIMIICIDMNEYNLLLLFTTFCTGYNFLPFKDFSWRKSMSVSSSFYCINCMTSFLS